MSPEKTETREMWTLARLLLGVSIRRAHHLIPGLVVAVLAWLMTLLSRFLGVELMGFEKTPVSPVMLAILCGLILGKLGVLYPAEVSACISANRFFSGSSK